MALREHRLHSVIKKGYQYYCTVTFTGNTKRFYLQRCSIVSRFCFYNAAPQRTVSAMVPVQEKNYLNVWTVHRVLWMPPDFRATGRASGERPGAREVRAAKSSDCSQTPRGEKLQRSNSRGATGDGRQRRNVSCRPVAFAFCGSRVNIHTTVSCELTMQRGI